MSNKTRKKKISKNQKKGEINYNSSMKRAKGGPNRVQLNNHIMYPFSYRNKKNDKKYKGHFTLVKNPEKGSPNNWCWNDSTILEDDELVKEYKLEKTITGDGKTNFCCPLNNDGIPKVPYRGYCEKPILYNENCKGGYGESRGVGDEFCCTKDEIYDYEIGECRVNNLGNKGKKRALKFAQKGVKIIGKSGVYAGYAGAATAAGAACIASVVCAIIVPVVMLITSGISYRMLAKSFKKNDKLLEDMKQSSEKTLNDLRRIEINEGDKYNEEQVLKATRLIEALNDIRKKYQPRDLKVKEKCGLMLSNEEEKAYIPTGQVLDIMEKTIDGNKIKFAKVKYQISPPKIRKKSQKSTKKKANRIAKYNTTLNLILALDIDPPDDIKKIQKIAESENREITDEEYEKQFNILDNLIRNKKQRQNKDKILEITLPFAFLRKRENRGLISMIKLLFSEYKKAGGKIQKLMLKAKKFLNEIDNDENNLGSNVHHPILGTNGRIIKNDEEYKKLEEEMLEYIENNNKLTKVGDAIKEIQGKTEEIETVTEIENKPGFENLNETEKKELIKEAVSTTKGQGMVEGVTKISDKISSTKSKEDLLNWYNSRLDEVVMSHQNERKIKKEEKNKEIKKGGGVIMSRRTEREQVTIVPKITLDQVVKQRMSVNKTVKKFKKFKKFKKLKKLKKSKKRTRRR